MSVVVDASVALDWIFGSERTPWANQVLEKVLVDGGVVPAHFPCEVANGLLVGIRKRRFAQDDLPRAFALLDEIELVERGARLSEETRRTIFTGLSSGLTAYDAAYLELALRESLPLATHDGELRAAARAAGAKLFGDE
jgi:predicted nucleic acid-binding protein